MCTCQIEAIEVPLGIEVCSGLYQTRVRDQEDVTVGASCNPIMSPSPQIAAKGHQQDSTCTSQGQVRVLFPRGVSSLARACYSQYRVQQRLNCRQIGAAQGLLRRLTGVLVPSSQAVGKTGCSPLE